MIRVSKKDHGHVQIGSKSSKTMWQPVDGIWNGSKEGRSQ